eukprot:Nitzschia sp. Nitz4//scaffold259_size27336//17878//19209//NITZ4_008193-RA/size27336-processed-gene-0.6-mRNA-1//-1//CDS//3329544510//2199//frame0
MVPSSFSRFTSACFAVSLVTTLSSGGSWFSASASLADAFSLDAPTFHGKVLDVDTPVTIAVKKAIDHLKQEQGQGRLLEDENATLSPYDPNPCDSEIYEYVINLLLDIGDLEVAQTLFIDWYGMNLPTYAVMLLSEGPHAIFKTTPEYFGVDGSYTEYIEELSSDIIEYWAVNNPDYEFFVDTAFGGSNSTTAVTESDTIIRVKAMRGSQLQEPLVLELLCMMLFGLDYATCFEFATDFDSLVQLIPGKYEHPLFSANAFNADVDGVYDLFGLSIPPMVVIGDGILDFLEQATVDTSLGVDVVVAHEFVHMAQMEWFKDESDMKLYEYYGMGPQYSRFMELMADAFAGYYLADVTGANYTVSEIEDSTVFVRAVGDPVYDSGHGTSGQRECALVWGALEAQENMGQDFTFNELFHVFDDVHSLITEGNSTVCPGIEANVTCDA